MSLLYCPPPTLYRLSAQVRHPDERAQVAGPLPLPGDGGWCAWHGGRHAAPPPLPAHHAARQRLVRGAAAAGLWWRGCTRVGVHSRVGACVAEEQLPCADSSSSCPLPSAGTLAVSTPPYRHPCPSAAAHPAGSTRCWRRPRTSACTCSPSCSSGSRVSCSAPRCWQARVGGSRLTALAAPRCRLGGCMRRSLRGTPSLVTTPLPKPLAAGPAPRLASPRLPARLPPLPCSLLLQCLHDCLHRLPQDLPLLCRGAQHTAGFCAAAGVPC